MQDKIKKAFDEIHAEKALLVRTEEKLAAYRAQQSPMSGFSFGKKAAAAVCGLALAAVVGIWGYSYYLIPVSAISVDVDSSIQLGLSRAGQVVTVERYQEEETGEEPDLRFLSYQEAVEQILATDEAGAGETATITVVGADEKKSEELLEGVSSCIKAYENVGCTRGSSGSRHAAAEAEMSVGKYRAYEEIKSLYPEVTPEEVQQMSMRELREWSRQLEGGQETEEAEKQEEGQPSETSYEEKCDGEQEQRRQGSHHGEDRGKENGRGAGAGSSAESGEGPEAGAGKKAGAGRGGRGHGK